MKVEFRKISGFKRGVLLKLLTDAYSFDAKYMKNFLKDWQAFDDFFFDNIAIADKCGFITTINNEAAGFVSWDPRNMPEYAIMGHNCLATKYKGKGYGKLQMQEAVRRIMQSDIKKIIVTTDIDLVPAQRMYESAGFVFVRKWSETDGSDLTWEHIDYEYNK